MSDDRQYMTDDEEDTAYDTTWSEQPSTTIAMAVAEETGREPTDGPVLDEYIDTGALDDLLSGENPRLGGPIRVSFVYDGVEVTVDSDGGITVRPPLRGNR